MIASRVALGCLALAISVCTVTIGRAADNAGEGLYANKCRKCHGPEGGGAQGPTLVPFNWSDQEALKLIRQPECDMPPIPESDLSDAEALEIVAYLRAIK
jgi:mono/diheme cytochrome c family protein